MFFVDERGRCTYVNPRYSELLGEEAGTTDGLAWIERLHEHDAQRVLVQWRSAVDHDAEFESRFRLRKADGHVVWVHGKASPRRDPRTKGGYVGTLVEISADDQTIIQKSDQRFRDLCSDAQVGIFIKDANGKCSFMNEACAAIIGCSPDQSRVAEFWSSCAACQRVIDEWTAAFEVDAELPAEHRCQRADGSVAWVQGKVTARRDGQGNLLALIGTVMDVTQRKQAEDFLEQENQLLAAAARGMSLGDGLLRLVRFIEGQRDDMIASVLLLDPDGLHLRNGAAPGLDPAYNDAVDGLRIGEGVGSCGTAAFRGEPVFVDDIGTDPLWAPYRELVESQGLKACWSTPITGPSGEVLGTFAIYRRKPGPATAQDRQLMDAATDLASILLIRHRGEQSLMESEHRFRSIFEQAAVGVAQINSVTGVILEVNRRYGEIVGIPAEELLGRTWMELTHPDDLAKDLASMQRLCQGEIREFNMEKRLERKDGSFVHVDLAVSAMWRPGEPPSTHIAIVEDISERKRVEQQLRLTQFSVDSCDSPIFWIRRDASFLFVNDAATNQFGFSREELLSMSVHDIDPRYPAESWSDFWEMMQQEQTSTFETQMLHREGGLIPVEITTNLLEFEDNEFVFAFVTDITHRRRMEEAIRTNAERLDLAMSVNNNGLFDWNVITSQAYFDRRYYTMAGYEPDEFPGTYDEWAKRVHPEDFVHVGEAVRQFIAGKRSDYDQEFRFKCKDGEWMWVRARVEVVSRDATGKPLRIVGTHTDINQRKRAEDALRESEERWQFALEGSRDGVWDWDATTNEVYYSRRWKEMLGYEMDEISNQFDEWKDRIHPADEQRCFEALNRHLRGETPFYQNEHRVRCKDGTYKWILNRGKVISRSADGTPQRTIGTHTDITLRKRAAEALRESEERFRNLVETAPFGVQQNDLEGRITFANAALGRIYGVDPQQLIGRLIWDFAVDEQSHQQMRDAMAGQSREPRPVPNTFETKNRTLDGRVIDVNIDWTFNRDSDANIVGFIVVVTDITGRKASERELAFQADVLNRVNDAVLVMTSTGKFTYTNEAAERLFCRPRQVVGGTTLSGFYDELLVSGTNSEAVRSSLDRSGTWQGDNEFEIDGEVCTFETKLKEFQSPSSDERLLLAVMRDISMRKRVEQERRQHRDVLAHMTRLSTMGELVAGIAHEVKQPLYAISNFATAASISLGNVEQELAADATWLDDIKEFNDGVRRASQRANEIIQRLREFARKSEQQRENINLNDVVQDSIELVAFEARQCNAVVETQLADRLDDVIADRIQCEQVLVNLLHNAYEALSERDPPRCVTVRTRQVDGDVEIQIADNGPGIAVEQQGKYFEAFRTTKPNGIGMGLAISRTIVEDHGGRLWVTTNELGGATFHVTLPVAEERIGISAVGSDRGSQRPQDPGSSLTDASSPDSPSPDASGPDSPSPDAPGPDL